MRREVHQTQCNTHLTHAIAIQNCRAGDKVTTVSFFNQKDRTATASRAPTYCHRKTSRCSSHGATTTPWCPRSAT